MQFDSTWGFFLFKRYFYYVRDQYTCFIKPPGITKPEELVNKYDISLMERNSVLLSNNTTSQMKISFQVM